MKICLPMILLVCVLTTACRTSQDTPQSSRRDREPRVIVADPKGGEPWLDVRISDEEKAIIREYYASQPAPKRLPPGLQKKVARGGQLPPGWQKKLARGQVMDDELYGQCEPLPPVLMQRLPRQRDDVITVEISGKVVRLAKATKEILDILEL